MHYVETRFVEYKFQYTVNFKKINLLLILITSNIRKNLKRKSYILELNCFLIAVN